MKSLTGNLSSEELAAISQTGYDLYKKHKDVIKKSLGDIISDPEKHGYEGDIAKGLKDISSHESMWWKIAKNSIKHAFAGSNLKNLAELLMKDLEDAKTPLLDKYAYKAVLDNPQDAEFNLEEATITRIKTLAADERRELWNQIVQNKGFSSGAPEKIGTDLQTFGSKLKTLSYKLWEDIKPILSQVLPVLIKIGTGIVTDLVSKNVSGPLKDPVIGTINGASHTLGDILKHSLEQQPVSSEIVDESSNEIGVLGETEEPSAKLDGLL